MSEEIMNILRSKLEILENNLALIVDPKMAVTILFDIILTKVEISNRTQPLSPSDYLHALDELEDWYKLREYDYPYPTRLKEQRDYWQSKLQK